MRAYFNKKLTNRVLGKCHYNEVEADQTELICCYNLS